MCGCQGLFFGRDWLWWCMREFYRVLDCSTSLWCWFAYYCVHFSKLLELYTKRVNFSYVSYPSIILCTSLCVHIHLCKYTHMHIYTKKWSRMVVSNKGTWKMEWWDRSETFTVYIFAICILILYALYKLFKNE
jgi:hypothetical protein